MHVVNSTGGLMLQTMLYLANYSSKIEQTGNMIPKDGLGQVTCYGVYGCFPIDGPWMSDTRQANVVPEKPSKIKPRFPVFSSKNTDRPMFIDLNDPEGIKDFGINPYGKIYLISHGYLEAGDRPWLREMTKTLLDYELEGTASVIIVDWGGGSSPPYIQAVANIRLVGAITAHVIHMIYEELSMPNLDNVHMIGHSLGAQLAGYAGYTLQKDFGLKMGRITGLDPAEPFFGGTDPVVRLDKSDAKFVDVIHTDASAGGLGMSKAIGHVDFYPNGGYDNPGCGMTLKEYMNKADNVFWGMQQFVGCNHIRSYQFFIESIYPKCPFTAVSCDSFENFKAGKCFQCENGHHCFRFGYDSILGYKEVINSNAIRENEPITAYLITGSEKPFCRVHYKLTVKVSSSDESAQHGGEVGTLSIKLHSYRKKETEMMKFSSEPMYFEPGLQYSSVVAGKDIGEPAFATVKWVYETNLLNPLTWRILASPRVYIDYIEIESLEHLKNIKLCPKYRTPIIADSLNTLQVKYCPNS